MYFGKLCRPRSDATHYVASDQGLHCLFAIMKENENLKKIIIFIIIINTLPLNGQWTGLLGKVEGSIRYYNGSR